MLLLGAFNAVAQESAREFTVDFPVGSSRLDLTWGANGRSIYKLTSFLRSVMDNPKMKINDITVYGTASPEGNADFNRRLALKRRDALRDVIIERAMVPDSVFTLQNEYIQWGLLRGMIKQCDAPWRDKAVAAIDENYVSSAGFETSAQVIKALKRIDGGRVWKELLVEYFPQMRNASAVVVTFEQLPAFREEYIEIPVDTAVPEPEPEPEPEIVVYEEPEHRCFYMDIRTDMLYDAALVPNLGVDFYLGRNISVGGNWQYAWWSKDSRHRYWRLYGGDINFTNTNGYLLSTGYERTFGEDAFTPAERATHNWGVTDHITFDRLYRMVTEAPVGKPWHIAFLTLASHEPWQVPYGRIKGDEVANAFAYLDDCLGRFIARFRQTMQWRNTLVVILPDHGSGYPSGLTDDNPRKSHIPMIWTGGAVRRPLVVDKICNQSDLPATLLGAMGLPHGDFRFSRNVMSRAYKRPSAVHTWSEGIFWLDDTGLTVINLLAAPQRVMLDTPRPSAARSAAANAFLQTAYDDLGALGS